MDNCPFVSKNNRREVVFLNNFLRLFYNNQYFFTGSIAMLGFLCELDNDLPKLELREIVEYANKMIKKEPHYYEKYIKNFDKIATLKIIRSTIKDIDLGMPFENGNQFNHFVERMNAIGYSTSTSLFDPKKSSYVFKKKIYVSPPVNMLEGPQSLKPFIKVDVVNSGKCQKRAYFEYMEYMEYHIKNIKNKESYDSPRKEVFPSMTEMIYQIALSETPEQSWHVPYMNGVTYGDVMRGIRVFIPSEYDFVLIDGSGKPKKSTDIVYESDHLFLLMTQTIILDVLQKNLIPSKPEYHMILDDFPVVSIGQLISRKLDAIKNQNEILEMDDRDKIKNLYDYYVLTNTLTIL